MVPWTPARRCGCGAAGLCLARVSLGRHAVTLCQTAVVPQADLGCLCHPRRVPRGRSRAVGRATRKPPAGTARPQQPFRRCSRAGRPMTAATTLGNPPALLPPAPLRQPFATPARQRDGRKHVSRVGKASAQAQPRGAHAHPAPLFHAAHTRQANHRLAARSHRQPSRPRQHPPRRRQRHARVAAPHGGGSAAGAPAPTPPPRQRRRRAAVANKSDRPPPRPPHHDRRRRRGGVAGSHARAV